MKVAAFAVCCFREINMQQNFQQARDMMVESQVRPNKVTDEAVVEAMRATPREKFLPPALAAVAYTDEDIALGHGRFMAEPMVVARLLQAAQVKKTDNVLDIGCGTGYTTALLSMLAHTVVGIEHDKHMAAEGTHMMQSLGLRNAHIVQLGDLQRGYADKGLYDAIVIAAAVASIPESLKTQLSEDGGRLVTVIAKGGLAGTAGTAVLVTRRGGTFHTQTLFDATTPVLVGFEAPKGFVF